ncbi:PAS domain-containing sensor histidine kinase [Rufibacter ruber]|uniref:PAS domain-containing sensor histidine kinase n=1 Tax=Rufibacter ruber TaxID=1783499 RepID=UPI00083268E6|nr:PAS domain-containing sensor histidine kinase [Rufibacter ruber]
MSLEPYPSDFYQQLLEKTGQAFFAYSVSQESFIYQSPSFIETYQGANVLVNPQGLLSLVHPEDQEYVRQSLRLLLDKGRVHQLELRVQLPEQEEQWVCLQLSLLARAEGDKVIIGRAEDITAVREYNDHLKKFSNKKDSILNILSHDLSGPLGIIHSLAQMLEQTFPPEGKAQALEIIRLIEQNSRKGAALIREFMSQEFLESEKTELITRRVNLVEKLKEAIEEYGGEKGTFLSKKVSFVSSKDEIFAMVDDLKFLQVLTNLLSNAIKFTPEGGTITVFLEDEETTVLVKVEDTGVGIPQKYHSTLFEKFTDARRPGLLGEESIGLGMSICKTLVEWHRGTIWFDSKEGKGTTFYIRIPKE